MSFTFAQRAAIAFCAISFLRSGVRASALACSKKWENLEAAYALWFAYYNFCRVHQTLKVTPAMESGIASTVWELKDLIAV